MKARKGHRVACGAGGRRRFPPSRGRPLFAATCWEQSGWL